MKFGIGQFTLQIPPWDERDHAALYDDTLRLAEHADALGFDSFWLAEHHGAADGYNPSLLPFLGAVAARTERMEVGTAVLLAPFHDPLRLAEDAAVVDNLSGGRLNLGLGLGWAPEEYRMFGVEQRRRGIRQRELIEVLRLAWTQERFSFDGSELSYDDISITPKPKRVPPIWLGGMQPSAVERAAKIADGHFPASTAGPEAAVDRAREVMKIRTKLGLDGPYKYGTFLPVGIGADADDGWRKIRDGILHVRGAYAMWGQNQRDVGGARDFAAQFEDQIRAGCVCGTPEEIVERLKPVCEDLDGLGFAEAFISIIVAPPGTPPQQAADDAELFATKIAPALRS